MEPGSQAKRLSFDFVASHRNPSGLRAPSSQGCQV
jgi:hypothetical protein